MTIRVRNLCKTFNDFAAVDNLSFDIEAGETFALLGPNGSGKTTTLKCLVGLTHPTSGQISINGVDLARNAREAKRFLSYLPQRVSFSDQLTGREVLEFYSRLRRLPLKRIDETLDTEHFHFNGFFDRSVGQFSGGMIQRLGLAVACLPDAPILVLDEPTVSLDPNGALQFRKFLSTLKQEGKTIVFSSHVLSDVEQLADRVAIMVDGKLVALKSVAEFRAELMGRARMRLVLSNASEQLLKQLPNFTSATLDGNSILIMSNVEDRLEILRAIEASGGHIQTFATEELSLEDIYMSYIKNVR